MDDDAIERRFGFAQRLADIAGDIIRPCFRRRIDVTNKGDARFYDPVTEADSRAEEAMRGAIAREYPQDGIIGEEFGEIAGTSGFVWVIDPVDGTRAFIAGQPLWGTLIGLEISGQPVLGVLDQPFLRERFIGRNRTAQLHTATGALGLQTRACAVLSQAVISTTHPFTHFRDEERARFFRVERECLLSRYGGDCYAYGLLAMGFIDLVIEAGLKHWDVAALFPIIEGAGGILTDWQGQDARQGGNVIAAGDARVHAAALALLAD
jgi:histidinol phosphatase-like enzyme (inositol monophosphatase family)